MALTRTTQTTTYTGNQAPNAATAGDPIAASSFNKMIDVLESLASHTHIFYDDYTTVCECQCQCQCNRGIL